MVIHFPEEVSIKKLKQALNLTKTETLGQFANELLDLYITQNAKKEHTEKILDEEILSYSYIMEWDRGRKKATGFSKDGIDITIRKGSDFSATSTASLSKGYTRRRKILINSSSLEKLEDGNYRFIEDVTFSSFSTAASTIRGMQVNGKEYFVKNNIK